MCMYGLVMFLMGTLPMALQHVQHPLMYNLEHAHACMLLQQVKDMEHYKEVGNKGQLGGDSRSIVKVVLKVLLAGGVPTNPTSPASATIPMPAPA